MSNAQSAPARLGLILRTVTLSPGRGFPAALAITARRARAGSLPAEGRAPYVLAAAGGVAAMLLWLKLGGLFGRRDVTAGDFRWAYFAGASAVGAAVGLAAQRLWGVAGSLLRARDGSRAAAPQLRLVWGAAAFPQVAALAVLLPFDLVIVGPRAFTTDRIAEPFAAGWAGLSIALALSLAAWSAYLLYRGARAVGLGPVAGIGSAVLCWVAATAVLLGVAAAIAATIQG